MTFYTINVAMLYSETADSPDLAPRLHPIPKLKINQQWVNGKDSGVFSSVLMTLEHRGSNCITLEANYIEKEVDLNRR